MNKIIGERVYLKDGTSGTIKKIEGDSVFELFIYIEYYGKERGFLLLKAVEKGTIRFESNKIQEEMISYIKQQKPTEEQKKKEQTCEKERIIIESKPKPLATSYKELNRIMYHGGGDIEFYHYTAGINAIEIIKTGFIYSRQDARYRVKYDNAKKIDMTDLMTSTNKSWALEKYARFYLNTKNAATYRFHKSYEENSTFGVIFALSFDSIWKTKTHVILTPINAHYLTTSYFDWKTYDISNKDNIANYNASDFNYNKTFEEYDRDNQFLMAEILFYNKVGLDNVAHIYFYNKYEKDLFLSKLDYNKRKLVENKCEVNRELFW